VPRIHETAKRHHRLARVIRETGLDGRDGRSTVLTKDAVPLLDKARTLHHRPIQRGFLSVRWCGHKAELL